MTDTIDSLRQRLRQLQAQHDSGALDAPAHAQARAPLEQALLAAVMADNTAAAAPPPSTPPSTPPATAATSPRRLLLLLATGVLVLGALSYSLTGSPELLGVGPAPAGSTTAAAAASGAAGPGAGDAPISAEQVADIVARLEQGLKDRPDDAAGWALLARAHSAMGRFAEAVPAYRKAVSLRGDDAALLADYADTLAGQANGTFGDEAIGLVNRALALDPDNVKALVLSGSAAFDARDYRLAVQRWERVAQALPPDSPSLQQVRASIAEARRAGGLPAALSPVAAPATAAPVAAASTAASTPASTSAPTSAAAVSGRVSLAPALAGQVRPDDTVFILARPASGPRMPLAVLRKQVKDLPMDFRLDDSMAMAPGATLSAHTQVVITARVSKGGDALSQPGDLVGQSATVAPGASGIVIEIGAIVGR